MNISHAIQASREYKYYRKCLSISASLQRRMAWLRKHQPHLLGPIHELKYAAAVTHLEETAKLILEHPSEINSLLSSRPMMKLSAKEIHANTFVDLPEPGKAQLTDLEEAVTENMTMVGQAQRATRHQLLLQYEIAYRTKLNWFLIFNTLTVSDGNYHKIFSKGSTAFKTYIQRVSDLIGHSAQQPKHTYMAVVEHGAKHDRLHIHVVHCLEQLPKAARDPNTGLPLPNKRELDCFKPLWEYGWSSPIMVRYSPNDAFGRTGYRWPHDNRKGKPLKMSSPLALASYMSKYILKSHASKRRKSYQWRVRKSQKLGIPLIREMLQSLSTKELLTIASTTTTTTRLNRRTIPPSLLKTQALKILNSRPSSGRASFLELASTMLPALSPLQSLRDSSGETSMSNLPSSINLKTLGISDKDISDAAKALNKAARYIEEQYFTESIQGYGTTSTADHWFK